MSISVKVNAGSLKGAAILFSLLQEKVFYWQRLLDICVNERQAKELNSSLFTVSKNYAVGTGEREVHVTVLEAASKILRKRHFVQVQK